MQVQTCVAVEGGCLSPRYRSSQKCCGKEAEGNAWDCDGHHANVLDAAEILDEVRKGVPRSCIAICWAKSSILPPSMGVDVTVQDENVGNTSDRSRGSATNNAEMSCFVQEVSDACLRMMIGAGSEVVPQEDAHSDVAK